MIDWRSLAELDAYLTNAPPLGLCLNVSLNGRTAEDPVTRIARVPEELVEDGLGAFHAWAGLVDTVPFLLLSATLHFGLPNKQAGHGFEVRFPACLGSDRGMFEALAKLPMPVPESLLFDSVRPGKFGVAPVGDRDPVYTSSSREDAEAAIELLNGWERGRYELIEVEPGPLPWLVVGPVAGPFISRVLTARDESGARHLATRCSKEYGATFRVARMLA